MKAIHPSLKDSAADYLREQILTGQLTPGTKIDQDEISAALGISRLPVREALIQLANEGLVDAVPRRGAFVASLERADIVDHYRVSSGLVGGAGGEPGGDVAQRCRPRRVARDPRESFTAATDADTPSELEPRVPPAHQPRRRLPPAGVGARRPVAQPAGALLRVRARVGRDIGPPPRGGSSLRSSSAYAARGRSGSWKHHVTESGELAVGILQEMGYWDAIPTERASTSGAA